MDLEQLFATAAQLCFPRSVHVQKGACCLKSASESVLIKQTKISGPVATDVWMLLKCQYICSTDKPYIFFIIRFCAPSRSLKLMPLLNIFLPVTGTILPSNYRDSRQSCSLEPCRTVAMGTLTA